MYDENVDYGSLGWTVVSGTGVIIGEDLIGPDRGSQLEDGCCVARHRWSGTALLCVRCIRSTPDNWKGTRDKRTRGCTAAKRHDFEKHANPDHQPPERLDVESLKVFWKSAEAADDAEQAEFMWRVGAVLAVHCHHE